MGGVILKHIISKEIIADSVKLGAGWSGLDIQLRNGGVGGISFLS